MNWYVILTFSDDTEQRFQVGSEFEARYVEENLNGTIRRDGAHVVRTRIEEVEG